MAGYGLEEGSNNEGRDRECHLAVEKVVGGSNKPVLASGGKESLDSLSSLSGIF